MTVKDHITDKADGLALSLVKMQEQEEQLQSQLDRLRSERHQAEQQLRREQRVTASMKQSIWRSKDQGVIAAREDLLETALLDFDKTDAGQKWKSRPVVEEMIVGGEVFKLPDLLGDRTQVRKQYNVFVKNHQLDWYDPLCMMLFNFINQRKSYATALKKHVWKSLDPEVIRKRRDLMVAMKLM